MCLRRSRGPNPLARSLQIRIEAKLISKTKAKTRMTPVPLGEGRSITTGSRRAQSPGSSSTEQDIQDLQRALRKEKLRERIQGLLTSRGMNPNLGITLLVLVMEASQALPSMSGLGEIMHKTTAPGGLHSPADNGEDSLCPKCKTSNL